MDNYNDEVLKLEELGNYRKINKYVMNHTYDYCKNNKVLIKAIKDTIDNSYIVYDNDKIIMNDNEYGKTNNIIVSNSRSFEAANKYKKKK